jgi:DNA mismatch endonuclease, patch repair protein
MKSIRARAPSASSDVVRRVMQANRSFNTTPEARLRSALHQLGIRFRKHVNVDSEVKCKADVVFRRVRTCIFVDGCYWHGCPKHFQNPKANHAWWKEKIADNRNRDRRKTTALRKRGWTVIRIWEHQLKGKNTKQIARRIANTIKRKPLGPQ